MDRTSNTGWTPRAVLLAAVLGTTVTLGTVPIPFIIMASGEGRDWLSVSLPLAILCATMGAWRLAVRSYRLGYVPPLSLAEQVGAACLTTAVAVTMAVACTIDASPVSVGSMVVWLGFAGQAWGKVLRKRQRQ